MKIPFVYFHFTVFLCPDGCEQNTGTVVISRSGKSIHSRIKSRIGFSAVLLLSVLTEGFAQADTSRTLKEVAITSSLLPVVQTANPSQQINSSEFKRYNAFNVADAIRNFSGVNIKDYGGIGGLKTVSVRSLGANHTGVEYNGVQINDSQNGQIDLGKINLDNVETITLYNGQPEEIAIPARSFASASVLIIKSKRPKFDPSKPYNLSLQVKGGSFGLFNPSLSFQRKMNEKWSFGLTGNWQQANGRYKYKVEGDGSDTLAVRSNADLNALHTEASAFWNGGDSVRLHFQMSYYHSDRGLPGAVVYYNPYSSQHLWNRDFFVQAGFDKKWNSGLRLILHSKVSRNYLRYLDPEYLNQAGKLDQKYTQLELYQSGVVSYKPISTLEISYSSDLAFNKLNTNSYNYAYPERFTYLNVLASKFKTSKLSVQASILNTHIYERVQTGVSAPARTVWSPTVSATYRSSSGSPLLLRAFYKDIFRNPTFNDLYYTRMGNRSLKPELAKQYNLGITYNKAYTEVIDYLAITADAYYNHVKDKIIAIPNKDLFSWTMLNLGKVDIRGIDAGMKTRFIVNSKLNALFSANYTFQEALDVTDRSSSVYLNQIPYTPKHTLTLNGGFDSRRIAVYYNHTISSSRYYLSENLPEYFVPGFSVADISATWRFVSGKIPISLSSELNNVYNTSYAFIRSFPMPGRSVRFSLQVTI